MLDEAIWEPIRAQESSDTRHMPSMGPNAQPAGALPGQKGPTRAACRPHWWGVEQ